MLRIAPGVQERRIVRVIVSARMRLVPATVALARAELANRAAFSRLLSASVPDQWPPEMLADALPTFLEWIEAAPDLAGWYVWYAMIRRPDSAADILGASAGFKGPPEDGTVEIGYSVLPQFQGRGYATEMVRSLTEWAFRQPGVDTIIAQTAATNMASLRVLEKTGFVEDGPGTDPGDLRFVLRACSRRPQRP